MVTKEVVINNQVGLHARPATFFIQKANEFKSSIWVEKEDRRVNAKSLLVGLHFVDGIGWQILQRFLRVAVEEVASVDEQRTHLATIDFDYTIRDTCPGELADEGIEHRALAQLKR